MAEPIKPRLIEVDFPIREVSEASVREGRGRGHISTLHVWWARRPLAASRATALAALLPDDPNRRDELLKLVKDIAPWERVSNSTGGRLDPLIHKARDLIREAFGGRAPRVLDCFAGGGSIPLEAMRLGCEVYAMDYNPVAVLLLKAVLEYPQKFGKPVTQMVEGSLGLETQRQVNPLVEAVKQWGNWVLEEARKELERFYPKDPDGSVPVGYIWARTLPCQNPACGIEIPLMHQTWLARKDNKKVALRMIPNRADGRIEFEIAEGRAIEFEPSEGTISGAHARCPLCGGTMDEETTRRLFREGRGHQRMVAVVSHHPKQTGRSFRVPTQQDLEAYRAAEATLASRRQALWGDWGVDPVPDEPLPRWDLDGRTAYGAGMRLLPYGFKVWGDLFSARQKLAVVTFSEKTREAHGRILREEPQNGFAEAVCVYLALAVDKLATYLCSLTRWRSDALSFERAFDRQALPMVWDFGEVNPFSDARGRWEVGGIADVVYNLSQFRQEHRAVVVQGSATELPWPANHFDAVLTDPPYYDNAPYSYFSDFFYVWLKRTVGNLYPDLFPTPLTPKIREIVDTLEMLRGVPKQEAKRAGISVKDKEDFQRMLTEAFCEINRVLRPDGIAVIVFAHKTTQAWESIINALLKAGLYMSASWPIHTEMRARLRAHESAALASSIYIVCRKRTAEEVAEFPNVRRQIEERVRAKLQQFWKEGIRGADFFMSAIGPAVEVFGRYARVEKLSGEPVEVSELLEYVRKVVSEFALERILKSVELGGVDAPTRFYLLWRWTYNHARVHFDEARKLGQGAGVELTALWEAGGLVHKEKEYVRVPLPLERGKDPHFAKRVEFGTMIDALHRAVWLWDQNEQRRLNDHLAGTYGSTEAFWQVAQAIAEILPDGDKERQLLQGLLYGRGSYKQMGLFGGQGGSK